MITNIKTTIPETNIPLDPNFEEKYRWYLKFRTTVSSRKESPRIISVYMS